MQSAAQAVSDVWPMMGELERLFTPSQRKTFIVEQVTPGHVMVVPGQTPLLIPRAAFEAALDYLRTHGHHGGNWCVIDSSNTPGKAGPLCRATRVLDTGEHGPRNITYVLPILQELGLVAISPTRPNSVRLTDANVSVVKHAQPSLATPLSPEQKDFANHLAALWTGQSKSFTHRYQTSNHRAWNRWKSLGKGDPWWCTSLAEAAQHYSWPEKPEPDDFASIAARLRYALKQQNNKGALDACLEIFKWGGVARKVTDASRVWVSAKAADGTLCSDLLRAVELLRPTSTQTLEDFDGKNLLMNSAMTKVYAAAAPGEIIIYDGRVGAALGLLARHWAPDGQVPSDLAFRWGPNVKTQGKNIETRDPSWGPFRFLQLYRAVAGEPSPTRLWADLVQITNRILAHVIVVLREQGHSVELLDLERALFMIGFDVRPASPSPVQGAFVPVGQI
ncbi:hypothetical protein [Pseudomonas sp. SED1]|uniref:hypothetical protein n=1 Tax=Pseudomonas sp. SED1 TaxID=3056845 RepID=UPI00296F684E|nr:hypothetical protein [Pseudomonas sp. SED1]MDY0831290.1 hypothetical protein [Pseudomonas sp. SED1]